MWIFNNLLYKVVALLVACILWSVAQGFDAVKASIDIPIDVRNLPDDVVVVGQSVDTINMSIQGTRYAVRGMQASPIRYVVSLDGVKAGRRTITVTHDRLSSLRRGAEVLAHSPDSVTFEVDAVVSRELRVRPDVVGEPAEGYHVVSVDVEPARVEIAGAQRSMRRLREIKTEVVDIGGLSQSLKQDAMLAPGVDHVWRAGTGERGKPVKITVKIERTNGADGADGDDGGEGGESGQLERPEGATGGEAG